MASKIVAERKNGDTWKQHGYSSLKEYLRGELVGDCRDELASIEAMQGGIMAVERLAECHEGLARKGIRGKIGGDLDRIGAALEQARAVCLANIGTMEKAIA